MTLLGFLAEHGEGLLPGVSVTLRQLHHQKSHPSVDDNFPTVAQRKSLLQLTVCLLYIIAIPETRRPQAVTEYLSGRREEQEGVVGISVESLLSLLTSSFYEGMLVVNRPNLRVSCKWL